MQIKEQIINIIKIYSIAGIGLIITILYRLKFNPKKKMNNILSSNYISILNNLNILFWSLTHLIMYIFLGFFAPNLWYISYALSILWEIFEYIVQDKYKFVTFRVSDFFTNAIGLSIGILFYYYLKRNKSKNEKKN